MRAFWPEDWSVYWISHKTAVTGYYPALSASRDGLVIRSAYQRGSSYRADTVSQLPSGDRQPHAAELRNFLPHQVNSDPYQVTKQASSSRTNISAHCQCQCWKSWSGHITGQLLFIDNLGNLGGDGFVWVIRSWKSSGRAKLYLFSRLNSLQHKCFLWESLLLRFEFMWDENSQTNYSEFTVWI